MSRRTAVALFFLIAPVLACNSQVGLAYRPVAAVQRTAAAPVVAIDQFQDGRNESSTWLGTIRGGFGNPLKYLETTAPVSDLVTNAFVAGARARGLTGDTSSMARYKLGGTIKRLDCDQMVRREATAEIQVIVSDVGTKQQRFARTYHSNNVEGSVLSLSTGVLGSVERLRALMETTLQQVVDQALDDPDLRSVVQ